MASSPAGMGSGARWAYWAIGSPGCGRRLTTARPSPTARPPPPAQSSNPCAIGSSESNRNCANFTVLEPALMTRILMSVAEARTSRSVLPRFAAYWDSCNRDWLQLIARHVAHQRARLQFDDPLGRQGGTVQVGIDVGRAVGRRVDELPPAQRTDRPRERELPRLAARMDNHHN